MEFYPATAPVPGEKRTDRLVLRPLRAGDVALDYDAVMASAEQLRQWSQSEWPADDFPLAENLADLEGHERAHAARKAFTFTVLAPDEARCLGCVYITPLAPTPAQACAGAAYAAHVGFWVRTSELAHDLDRHLLATLRAWFQAEWAFDCVVFIIGSEDQRQAAILKEAGLSQRMTFTTPEGHAWVTFGDAPV